MHRSRLAAFIIDCQTDDLDAASTFWSGALGMSRGESEEDDIYRALIARDRDLGIEVQKVAHASRIHLDIVSDDVDAEVARLEALGAKKVEYVKRWWVMEAPTGQRFCVIRARESLAGKPGVNEWP